MMKLPAVSVRKYFVGILSCTIAFLLTGCETFQKAKEGPTAQERKESAQRLSAELVRQGQAALKQERYGEARKLFFRALQDSKDNAVARLGIAESYLGIGDLDNAARQFSALTKVKSVSAAALQGKGITNLLLGRPQVAVEALQAAVAEDATLWRAWNGLGQYFDQKRMWDKSREAYRKALALRPGSSLVLNNFGISLILQKKYKEAENQFAAALKNEPKNAVVKNNYRLSLAWQGKYVEALFDLGGSSAPQILNDVGYVALLRGDYDVAEGYFARALKASPNFFEVASRNLQYLRYLRSTHRGKASRKSAAEIN